VIPKKAKYIVYTCVFDDYDWIFPPIVKEENISYVIMTDDPGLKVSGWETRLVDTSPFRDAKTANLHYRALSHKYFSHFDYSLYVDGNVRLIGKISEFLADFRDSGLPLGLFRHPLRCSVKEEAESCLTSGKVFEPDRLRAELAYQAKEGFPDNVGLIETTIILKNHRNHLLAEVMQLWWSHFERFGTRDQIGLPYAIWRESIPCTYQSFNFRENNLYFGHYTHKKDNRAPRYFAYIEGRSYDSLFYFVVLRLWKLSWSVRRLFRKKVE
jgi:hypothetical protein